MWRWLGDGVVGVHFAYLGYLIVGGFLAWRWPRTILLHGLAAIWAGLIILVGVPCPLTALQNTLREHAGQDAIGKSFIDAYVRGHFFPRDMIGAVQLVVGAIIVASWAGFLLRRHRTPGVTSVQM